LSNEKEKKHSQSENIECNVTEHREVEEEHRECAKLPCPLLILKWHFKMDCVFGGSKRAKTQNK